MGSITMRAMGPHRYFPKLGRRPNLRLLFPQRKNPRRTMTLRHTLEVTQANEPIALRLLSALVLGWDSLPEEIQLCLLHDAAKMRNGFPNSSVLPARIMAFVDAHKEQP